MRPRYPVWKRSALFSLPSALEVYPIRLWARLWPLDWGSNLPNRVLARLSDMGLLGPTWFEFQESLWIQLDIRDVIQETILEGGIWDPTATEYLSEILEPGNVFLDIGANAGYFTLLAGKYVGPTGRVLAVEPNPLMAEQVRRNASRSGLINVQVEEVACSDSPKSSRLYLGPPSNTGGSSLSDRNTTTTEWVDVACVQADDLVRKYHLSRIDLVKIDVEGAEHDVLRGMNTILADHRPKIVMELIDDLLGSFSTTIDSVLSYLKTFQYDARPLGGHSNYICVPYEQSSGCFEKACKGR